MKVHPTSISILLPTLSFLCSAIAQRVQSGDFAWAVEPADGYPTVEFSDEAEDGEVAFKYVYEGELSDTKFLSYEILQYNCLDRGDGAVSVANDDLSNPGELVFDANIEQSIITNSIHYAEVNDTFAEIKFCARVDYNYINLLGEGESINFHESKISIGIDRTAGFTISSIDVIRVNATEENTAAELDYPVVAYFCDDLSVETGPEPFTQGGAMQVCVKMDEEVVTEDVYVQDILSFTVSQPLGPASPSVAIVNSISDRLTSKVCGVTGICNVKTQLQSKFFVDDIPNDLRVDGTAIIAFGSPNGERRQLKTYFRGTLGHSSGQQQLESRRLQGTQSPFDLNVTLYKEEVVEGATNTTETTLMLGVLVSLVLSAFLCIVLWVCCGRTRRTTENVVVKYDMQVADNNNNKNSNHHHPQSMRMAASSSSRTLRSEESLTRSGENSGRCFREERRNTEADNYSARSSSSSSSSFLGRQERYKSTEFSVSPTIQAHPMHNFHDAAHHSLKEPSDDGSYDDNSVVVDHRSLDEYDESVHQHHHPVHNPPKNQKYYLPSCRQEPPHRASTTPSTTVKSQKQPVATFIEKSDSSYHRHCRSSSPVVVRVPTTVVGTDAPARYCHEEEDADRMTMVVVQPKVLEPTPTLRCTSRNSSSSTSGAGAGRSYYYWRTQDPPGTQADESFRTRSMHEQQEPPHNKNMVPTTTVTRTTSIRPRPSSSQPHEPDDASAILYHDDYRFR